MKRIIALFLVTCVTVSLLSSCAKEKEKKSGEKVALSVSGTSFTDKTSTDYIECGQSGNLKLSFQPSTTQIKVENSLDGSVWFSNPQNPTEDTYATRLTQLKMMSVLEMEYANTITKKRTSINIYTSNVKSGKYEIFKIENGVEFQYDVSEIGKTILLSLYLENGNLFSELRYKDSDKKKEDVALSSITVLPYFVRGSAEDKGYLFIPDGSGATVDFAKRVNSDISYKRNIYGYEPTALTSDYYLDVDKSSVCMPTYGTVVNGSALMAVCEEGAEYGLLKAEACGQTSSYARICTEYSLLNSVEYNVGNYDTELFDKADFSPDKIKTCYMFLDGENANYSGMARSYRDYLLSKNNLKTRKTSTGFYSDVYASVSKRVSTLGIPHNKTVSLTSEKELELMVEKLKKSGIEDIVVRYLMWNFDEIKGEKVTSVKGISPRKINSVKGAEIYPAILNLQTYSKSGFFDSLINSSKSITQLPFAWKSYSLSNLNENDKTLYRLSHGLFSKNIPKLITKLKNKNFKNIAFGDISNTLYCDYKDGGSKRDKAMEVMVSAIKQANDNFDSLMLDAPNVYGAVFADIIYNAPINNSNHTLLSKSVPFYEIAMSGISDCVASPYNSASSDDILLDTVASGAGFCVNWMFGKTTDLTGTELSYLSNVNFADTYEKTLTLYGKVNKVYSKINGSRIYSHNYINENVSVTEYENGLKIYVNFGDEPFTLKSGSEIPPNDFIAEER